MIFNVKDFARAALCVASVGAASLLASCGGGEQVSTFVPSRVIAFGDEFSVINTDGSKYTVNALLSGSATSVDCASNPIWIQTVAARWNLQFPQCNTNLTPDPPSRIWATNGATVADLSTQIDEQISQGGFTSGDLVTVLVGANDIVQQFQTYPTQSEAQISANLAAIAVNLATDVNTIAGYGAKVIIVTVPNMGLTPFAGDRSVGSIDTNPGLLSRLSTSFNNTLLANLLNDGHKIGLVQLDQYLEAVDTATQNGTSGATYANTTVAECTVALPKCTTNTLIPDAVSSVYLWADSRRLGVTGQAALGSLATQRASNNPF